ncbi:diguanylate cyclase [Vibrio sp. DW001]|uniref:sensor domain-containing diguanylate cyclase n=1 Tax=Vibrio sp. DW001 TaxID=2912315 RepID=UPI0023AF46A8|nr:diguanylate cyclase [Vibrio sp. DW001]WED25345.1 diguanylate cyclase [Vibrio sp. DW001]
MVIQTGNFENLDHTEPSHLENELLTAIARSAENLSNGRGWPEGVDALLADLGNITKVSRVWIFQTLKLEDNYIQQDYVFEWASNIKYKQIGLPSFNRFTSNTKEPEYISLIESRTRGEYQHLIVNRLPDSWLRGYLIQQHICSMLTIPIFVENQWWGTLGFDDCERNIEWSSSEIALLRTACFLISSAILRDQLSAKRRQLDILKQITACSAWELDIRRGHLWCTPEILSNIPEKTDNLQFSFRQCIRKIHPEYRKDFFRVVRQFNQSSSTSFRCDLKIRRDNGDYGWIELSAKIDDSTEHSGDVLAGILLDITLRKEAEERLRHEATTDPLTGILNRRKIESLVQEHIDRYKKTGEKFSLVVLDLDHFKRINDTYGHSVGDHVLCQFTELCQRSLRKIDYISRIGGEEFAILLPNTNEEEAFVIGNRICQTIQHNPYIHKSDQIIYSVSIGCSTLKDEYLEVHKIFERADSALYFAKRSGRNQVKVS